MELQGFIREIIIFYESTNFATLVAVMAYFTEKQKWMGHAFVSHLFFATPTDALPFGPYCVPLNDNICGFDTRRRKYLAKRTGRLFAALSVELVIFTEPALVTSDLHHESYSEDETVTEAFIADQFLQVIVDADEL